eukprot:1357621-Amorphochlora_amoeboformis.AAC.3
MTTVWNVSSKIVHVFEAGNAIIRLRIMAALRVREQAFSTYFSGANKTNGRGSKHKFSQANHGRKVYLGKNTKPRKPRSMQEDLGQSRSLDFCHAAAASAFQAYQLKYQRERSCKPSPTLSPRKY